MDRNDLNEFISYNLHELAWEKDYPLNENLAIWSFLNGMREAEFGINLKSNNLKVFYTFNHNGKYYELTTRISQKEILEGWKRHPKSSPQSLYDSIYLTIDRLQNQIKNKYPKWKVPNNLSDALFKDRADKGHSARKAMEKYFLEYFEKYQEGVLASLNGDEQSYEPKILDKLIDSKIINLDRINEALRISQFKEYGPVGLVNTSSTIKFLLDNEPLEEPFTISNSRVLDYIWGSYLLELAKLKGYTLKKCSLEETDYGMLEIACEEGWSILENLTK